MGCTQTESAPPYAGPIRFDDAPGNDSEPVCIHDFPLNTGWAGATGGVEYRQDEGVLVVRPEDGPPVIRTEVDLDLAGVTHLEVTLQVPGGSVGRVRWTSEIEPELDWHWGVHFLVMAGPEFATRRIPLRPDTAPPAVGRLKELEVRLSDEPVTARVKSVRFVRDPGVSPLRLVAFGEAQETLLTGSFEWRVRIPDAAVFVAPMVMHERAFEIGSDGVRFSVRAERADGTPVIESTKTYQAPAGWITRRFDLAEHAGEELTFSFAIDPLRNPRGDYAFWGRPQIYRRAPDDERIPVFLISCDTLRARNLPAFGYHRNTAPNLGEFINEAVLFEQAYTTCPATLIAHMTMLTGLLRENHGVRPDSNLADAIETLPQRLRNHGYLSAGITGHGWWLMPWRGYSRGFDFYSAPDPFRDVFQVFSMAKNWLEAHGGHPAFMFLHNYDIHSVLEPGEYPYDSLDPRFRVFSGEVEGPPMPAPRPDIHHPSELLVEHNEGTHHFDASHAAYFTRLYDDCIFKVDYAIADFFSFLKREGLYDNALIIVTSDHGESLGENDTYLHTNYYDQTLHVPLIVRFPGGRHAGKRVPHMVDLTALFPTVCEVLGIGVPEGLDGESLMPLVEGTVVTPQDHIPLQTGPWVGVRTRNFKLIEGVRDAGRFYYDLANDPEELQAIPYQGQPALDYAHERLGAYFHAPRDAWYAIADARAPWSGEVRMVSGDPSLRFWTPYRYDVPFSSESTLMWVVPLTIGPGQRQVLVSAVAGEGHDLTMFITARDTPFVLRLDGEAGPPSHACQIDLSGETPRIIAMEESSADGAAPVLIDITYRGAVPEGEEALAPSDEVIEQLEALGYLGE